MLRAMPGPTDKILVLPAHRLYNQDKWNQLDLRGRIDEILQHHIDRCYGILRALGAGPKTPREIAMEYFEPGLLKGFGIHLAVNEIKSHCEHMEISRDVVISEAVNVSPTGRENFRSLINDGE